MERLLPMTSKLGFGVGQIAEGVKATIFNTFVLFYYNQILGLPAIQTAFVLGVATLFDGITDPVAGYLSDRTRSRYGRRHPWLMFSALPLGATIIMLFCPPAGMSNSFYTGWLLVSSVSLHIFITLYHIPHLALGAEMARDYNDRTRIFSYSTFFGVMGGFGFYFIAMSLVFPSSPGYSHGLYNPHGYLPLSILAAIAIAGSIGLCVWGTWKEIPHLNHTHVPKAQAEQGMAGMMKELSAVFHNSSFRVLFISSLLVTVIIGIRGVFHIYMGVHFWELPTEKLRWLALMVIAGLPVSFMLAPVLTRLLDKRKTLIIAALASVVNDTLMICLRLFTDILPANNDPLLFALIMAGFFLGGAIMPILAITILSMLADVADEMELTTGKRQEGAIFSVRAVSLKAAGALGGVLGGIALDLIAFPTKAKAGAIAPNIIFKLGLLDGPIYAVVVSSSLLLLFGYRLDRAKIHKIKADLSARRLMR